MFYKSLRLITRDIRIAKYQTWMRADAVEVQNMRLNIFAAR
jgi:hypothetical protein